MTTGFTLAPELDADTYALGDLPLCRVLLMDDARYPWLILVPKRAEVEEIIDLSPADRSVLIEEIALAEQALTAILKPDKLNVGALGNVVRQLHVHVVARFASDEAGKAPIWGRGERKPYPPHMVGPLMDRLVKAMGLTP